jgi:enoyl-CoA hydratase
MTDQDKPYVRYEVSGGAATITLDSPHNRNAISTRLVTELQAGLTSAAADPAVRAVVLTHTGGTFCAGADLSEASGSSASPEEAVKERGRGMLTLLRSILELPKPVIGRIDGHVRAGGMGLVGACDIVVAGPASTFAVTESRLGLAASIISLASRYLLTGEKFGQHEAESIGLVTAASQDTGESITELLGTLRQCSPQGLAESKWITTRSVLAGFDRDGEEMIAQSARLFSSDEAREGMMSFLQKRPAAWAQ